MNTRNVLPALAASAALVATSAFANDDASSKSQNQRSQSQSQSQSGALSQIHRVTKESLEQQVTAKDLIGATVYDQNGENIGDIADVSIKRIVPQEVSQALRQKQQGQQQRGQQQQDQQQQGQQQRGQQQQGQMASADEQSWEDKAEQWGDSAKQTWDRMTGDATVFISVGGLFGIGDDIVAVPASQLSYDEANDQFTLNAPKDQVVALAEQEPREFEDQASWEQQDQQQQRQQQGQQYSAKQEFDQDVSTIREAIRNDSQLSLDTGIMVAAEEDQIVLEGIVSSEEAKDRAQEIAEQNTDMDVKNSIKVKKNR